MKYPVWQWTRILQPAIAGMLLWGCAAHSPTTPHPISAPGTGLLSGVEGHVSDVLQQALTGDPAARRMYGQWLAETGETEKARTVLTPAAEKGDIRAQYQLGLVLAGRNSPETWCAAVDWMTRAATGGLPVARRTLGDWLTEGVIISPDPVAALGWYQKAAEQGDARAQNATGAALSAGRGVPRNLSEALVWYRKAAEQGNALAAFNLGNVYWTGSGTRANAGVAFAWYALAENNAALDEGTLHRVAQKMKKRASLLAARRGRLPAAVALAEQYIRHYGRQAGPVPSSTDITE
ncbi:sel1 repeat family protein [Salmonella enterica]|uniref:Sel1 repeat family protein n=1 Tax=Salmonella enterica subsp. salamae TaxID=59202 RepID=A0A5Y1WPF3_SALER|nr:sel1 repeat family protein [Salmonella enterica subsp. salamae]ECH2416039.1 sel1 repeat family protein [Salmonella enterica]ECC1628764.1 sel1 repeat family protein [Salmonella enterica subsp. salamae]ECD9357527.1 sel1 repeat family protein [Salmonella enterica subsp. salamae]ECD9435389.1 sel1 repeat family protein [Salmonella enterica subsp. salamae]